MKGLSAMFSNWPQSADAIQTIGASAGGELLDVAKSAARLRTHMLLHTSHEDPVQRLLVALSRGTYIQPHRHNEQWEMIVPLKGTLALLLFSMTGVITEKVEITPNQTTALQISAGTWHTLAPVSENALMLEVKPGPFRPAEFAPWSPSEGNPTASRAAAWLINAKPGERCEYTGP